MIDLSRRIEVQMSSFLGVSVPAFAMLLAGRADAEEILKTAAAALEATTGAAFRAVEDRIVLAVALLAFMPCGVEYAGRHYQCCVPGKTPDATAGEEAESARRGSFWGRQADHWERSYDLLARRARAFDFDNGGAPEEVLVAALAEFRRLQGQNATFRNLLWKGYRFQPRPWWKFWGRRWDLMILPLDEVETEHIRLAAELSAP